jgi:hypothetical protein
VEEGLGFGREKWFSEVFKEGFEIVLQEVKDEEDTIFC